MDERCRRNDVFCCGRSAPILLNALMTRRSAAGVSRSFEAFDFFGATTSVSSTIICRSALAIEAHRGVASLANTLGIGCALRLALPSDGCAQPTTSDR